MDGVWEAIEEARLPVSHHIGENPPATPNEFNAVGIGMLQSVAPFRDMFGKYVFGGILDRHPGLQVGWFEGGINWVPSTIQDAQHIAASFRHLANLEVQHDPQHYWDDHMVASFMVDPLGLELIDRIGVDRVMWSTDFPHNESTYGYSGESLALGGRRGRARGRRRRSSAATSSATSGWTADARGADGRGAAELGIPATPDLARMRRDRVDAAPLDRWPTQGIDALVLLGNTQRRLRHRCDLAAGRRRPRQLRAAGRGRPRRRRVAAPVLARPGRRPARRWSSPPTTSTARCTSTSTRASTRFAAELAALVPDRRGASRSTSGPTPCAGSARSALRRRTPPADGGRVISEAKAVKTPDELAVHARRACASPSRPSPRCRPGSRPASARPT